jgi:hypothetical protein
MAVSQAYCINIGYSGAPNILSTPSPGVKLEEYV